MIFSREDEGRAIFVAKEDGIIAGVSIIDIGYKLLHPSITCQLYKRDGESVKKERLSPSFQVRPSRFYQVSASF
ncbi:nicotinate-nucleotide pyrophosphorylase [Anoxybacillus sp. BCO1]|nr:nicotinate-nucleotide pyrophosphorylase [Anoxybacillus sp. BCO1]